MNPTIAIIGSGFGMYCLLPAFSFTKECKVVSICGKDSERMSNFCEKYNVKQYNDWKLEKAGEQEMNFSGNTV